jgi:SAM-dependent methyltransferase
VKQQKLVLDACCGSRMFWFDREDIRTLYIDIREATRIVDVGTPGTIGRKPVSIKPDIIADFTNMPFEDNSFYHVVFDPPHFHKGAGANGRIGFSYGLLKDTWPEDLAKGFKECFRVLKPHGVLVFKWCESEIPLKDVLALTNQKPLYGHRSGKKANTHWVVFLKPGEGDEVRFDTEAKELLAELKKEIKL